MSARDKLTQTLAGDVTCASCGYNLRTLSFSALCPECNSPVTASLDPNRLIFADKAWLQGLYRWQIGTLATLAMAGAALVSFSMQFFAFLFPFVWNSPGWNDWTLAIAIMTAIAIDLHALSVWPATRGKPGEPLRTPVASWRRTTRAASIGEIAICGMAVAVVGSEPDGPIIFLAAGAISIAVTSFAYLIYLSCRIAEAPMRRLALAVRILVLVALLFLCGFSVAWLHLTRTQGWSSARQWLRDAPANCAGYAALCTAIAIGIGIRAIRRNVQNHVAAL